MKTDADLTSRSPWRVAIEVTLGSLVVAGCLTLIIVHVVTATGPHPQAAAASRTAPSMPPPSAPVSIDGALSEGAKSAPVVIIEYAHFECGACTAFAMGALPTLENTYIQSGRVALVFRQLPIGTGAPHATNARAAQRCARLARGKIRRHA